jgi:hypothetical protein
MRRVIGTLAVAALVLAAADPVRAEDAPSSCDYVTGGGYIVTTASGTHASGKADLCVAAGCKYGSPTWGHLEYVDRKTKLKVHGTSITAYAFVEQLSPDHEGELRGTRQICGTATTNHFGPVHFFVETKAAGEPEGNDEFIIRLQKDGVVVYTTEGDSDHTLGGARRDGGEIELEKPNRKFRTGTFSQLNASNCPAAPAPSCPPGEIFDHESGTCVSECPPGQIFDPGSGTCVSECPDGQVFDPGSGMCVPQCPDGQVFDPGSGTCGCPAGEQLCPNGTCIPETNVCVD